jgi:hypothetical protein
MPVQQGAQDHEATFAGQEFWRREIEAFENEPGEAVEGQDFEAQKAGELAIGKELAFKLEGGLLGREEDQRIAVGLAFEGGAHLGKAAESLAAAGGAEEETHGHGGMFVFYQQRAKGNLGRTKSGDADKTQKTGLFNFLAIAALER